MNDIGRLIQVISLVKISSLMEHTGLSKYKIYKFLEGRYNEATLEKMKVFRNKML